MEKDCCEDGCDCCEAPPSCGGCILIVDAGNRG